MPKGANPRFVVTSFNKDEYAAKELYENLYCARGDMENRIKEQQLMLFAARTSTNKMQSNQVRLYFSSIAYMIIQTLRRIGLTGTEMAKAQCDTIRLRMFKIGARIRITVRKIWVALADGYPYKNVFEKVMKNLTRVPLHI